MLLAGVLLLAALGLLGAGLTEGSPALQWASVAASAAAAVVLGVRWSRLRAAQVENPDTGTTAAPGAGAVVEQPSAAAVRAEPVGAEPADEPVVQMVTRPAITPSVASHPLPPAAAPVATPGGDDDLPVEEVEVTDLLLVLDLTDEVLVLDEHPRYHVSGCRTLAGGDAIGLPLVEARTDGFDACGLCRPDHTLAMRERARRAEKRAVPDGRH